MKRLGLTALFAVAFMIAQGCGGGSQPGPAAMPAPGDTTMLDGKIAVQVRNGYGEPIEISVSYGANRRRLGQVNTNSVETFTIDWRSGGFWMVVETVTSNRTVRSNGLDLPAKSVAVLEVTSDFTANLVPLKG
jgi:hypothetical protein